MWVLTVCAAVPRALAGGGGGGLCPPRREEAAEPLTTGMEGGVDFGADKGEVPRPEGGWWEAQQLMTPQGFQGTLREPGS